MVLANVLLWHSAPAVLAKGQAGPKVIVRLFTMPVGKVITHENIRDLPHYEVVEHCIAVPAEEADCRGPFNMGSGQGNIGNRCSVTGIVNAVTCFNGYNTASLPPLTARTWVRVIWRPGRGNYPEPKEGVRLIFGHASFAYTEAAGLGIKEFVGLAKAYAEAKTRGPGGGTKVKSESNTPLLGINVTPTSEEVCYVIRHAKSGWVGVLISQASVSSDTRIFGSALSVASAEITWKAELEEGGRR